MGEIDKLAAMKLGHIFYECEMGMNIRARGTATPVVTNDGYEGRRVLRWEAENTESGERIDYMMTEGLDHYGPRIYDQPQYARVKDGELIFPLVGAPSHD
jgi:hypothetical protein